MSEKNENARLETFCDGVFAIAITLLILEIKIPPAQSISSIADFWHKIYEEWPSWFGFTLSFGIIYISWVNHHIGLKHVTKSSPQFIYANGFLMLTVVVLPYTTELMAVYFRTPYAQPAISLYCFTALLQNIAWNILVWTIRHTVQLTKTEAIQLKIKVTVKNMLYAMFLYAGIFILSFWFPVTAMVIITTSMITWLILGNRMHRIESKHNSD